jgi:hypothetical protein
MFCREIARDGEDRERVNRTPRIGNVQLRFGERASAISRGYAIPDRRSGEINSSAERLS